MRSSLANELSSLHAGMGRGPLAWTSARRRAAWIPLLTLLALAGCAEAPAFAPARPNVVVLVVDTLRADRLSPYGGPASNSPVLAALAANAVVFEDAQSTAPWTLPSTASLLTGLHPYRHGADLSGDARNLGEDVPRALGGTVPTLAEILRDHGYATRGFATNPYLHFGLDRGFDQFTIRNTEGAEIVAWFREQASLAADRPLFLYGHFMDVHVPLLIPISDVQHVAEHQADGEVPPVEYRAVIPPLATAEVREAALLYYDAAVHYVDRCIGSIVEALESHGLLENTILCILSDHGEEFFEHYGWQTESGVVDPRGTPGLGHGHTLFSELIRVPWILAGPGLPAARIESLVSIHDFAPTLLEILGIRGPAASMDGASLVPLLRGEALPERSFLIGSIAYGHELEAVVTTDWKLIIEPGSMKPLLLFDRRDDPHELNDVLAANPDAVELLLAEIPAKREALQGVVGESKAVSDEVLRGLRAIGY